LHSRPSEYLQVAYDRVAGDYDDLWTPPLQGLNARLSSELDLRRGERVCDLACGTGVNTVVMAERVRPGEVLGVDYSEQMLASARERAHAQDLDIEFVQDKAEDYVNQAPADHYDVVSLRFALAYIDWRHVLPRIGRMVRRGGRMGLLSSLSVSLPQLAQLYHRFRKSPEPAWRLFKHTRLSVPETWRILRLLKEKFGEPTFVTVPESVEQMASLLAAGGLVAERTWTETVRMWFPSGAEAVDWMIDSGCSTDVDLEHLEPRAMQFLRVLFSAGMESFRERRGVPLDIIAGCVIARRV
jgi:ubiquinone/menaquinone biosynthesis C-methylase UbiE